MNLEYYRRLELLKSLIILGENELLLAQVEKLEIEYKDQSVKEIADAVRRTAYGDVVKKVDLILQDSASIQHYEDPEIKALQIELRILEDRWADLQDKKSERERQLNVFHIRYQKELGDLISKLLYLRKEHLREETESDTSRQAEYEEAQNDYEEHQQVFDEIKSKELPELNEEDLDDLKKCFREAAKLCHPDTAAEEIREKSADWFRKLTEAHQNHDLDAVKDILDKLKHGGSLPRESEFTNDKVRLRADIERLRKKMTEIGKELEEIEGSESWETIRELGDWDIYFEEKRNAILYEIENLQLKEVNKISIESQ